MVTPPAAPVIFMARTEAEKLGIPPRPFLYTVDQLSGLLSITEQALHATHLYHEGRDVGVKKPEHLVARNIAPRSDKPDWRVAERELVRWMKVKGFKYYERGWIQG